MQGRKKFTPQLFYQTSLDSLVPKDNYYRILLKELDLHYLYASTSKYYGREGQESIDPIVFFKILLVGYLNNINSDRALLRYCADSLSIRLFLGYDLDEELPWHSTISRTRQLYGEEVFLGLFQDILRKCVEKGMVRGKRQCVDSAFIKANASMDSLVEKEIIADAKTYTEELNTNSEYQVSTQKYKEVEQHHAWKKEAYQGMPGHRKTIQLDEDGAEIRPKFLSNHTHYSPTDPDAKISTKPGKPRQLNYAGQLSADDAHHVITGACVSTAGSKDSSIHKPLYDKMHKKLTENKSYHRRLVKRRSSTVEPVLGTLINHHNMKRINSRGLAQANKHVLMAALTYNLNKYLKFIVKKPLPITTAIVQILSQREGKNLGIYKASLIP